MIRDLSYRYKIPLRGSVLILITAAAIAMALIVRAAEDLRQDLQSSAEGVSRLLARTLVPALLRDDVWMAYEIIRSPLHGRDSDSAPLQPDLILVLDTEQRVYVSTDPKRLPLLTPVSQAGGSYAAVAAAARQLTGSQPAFIGRPTGIHILTPILADGVRLGTLAVEYSGDFVHTRLLQFAERAAITTALVLAVLLPVSWYWGARMARPLVQLAYCLGQIGPSVPSNLSCTLEHSEDEIGRVGSQFQRMLRELKQKQALETQMIAAERLAAVGRLTAGIAHEINNPLGGMLNALSTFRRYGERDEMTERTVSLIERGLLQVRETVSALLVEARPQQRDLTPMDLEDVRTLLQPSLQKRRVALEWENALTDSLPLSATLVRQILINLLLNAINAAPDEGNVSVRARVEEERLTLAVENQGEALPAEFMSQMYEPFVRGSAGGTGLGLWVTYQIVQQLGGGIDARSDAGLTRFNVQIPLPA